MKASELRELNNTELEEKLKSLKEELFNLRFQLAINQLETRCVFLLLRRTSLAYRQLCVRTNSKTALMHKGREETQSGKKS